MAAMREGVDLRPRIGGGKGGSLGARETGVVPGLDEQHSAGTPAVRIIFPLRSRDPSSSLVQPLKVVKISWAWLATVEKCPWWG
jgi:hypothetical protein